MMVEPPSLSADAVKAAARACGFPLVGLTRAQALPDEPLRRWLDAGHAAGMTWMSTDVEARLDPRKVLVGARTVLALAIPYHRPDEGPSVVARYARGRDYHYAHRDRMKALRKALVRMAPGLETYACVDTGLAMEKPWAERAGLGWIGKNGCLITVARGSWVTLSVMFLDRDVDVHDEPHPNLCGTCTACLRACPTGAFAAPGVVDAGRCVSYQSIENRDSVPAAVRPGFKLRVFGCDVCQEVCPFNRAPAAPMPPGDDKFAPRPLGHATPETLAALTRAEFDHLTAGMALARAQHDGLRRNAILALGAARAQHARPLLMTLAADESAVVAEAARWALAEIDAARP